MVLEDPVSEFFLNETESYTLEAYELVSQMRTDAKKGDQALHWTWGLELQAVPVRRWTVEGGSGGGDTWDAGKKLPGGIPEVGIGKESASGSLTRSFDISVLFH